MWLSLQLFVVLRVVDFLVFGCGGETKIGCSVLSATFVIATKELFTRIIKYIWVLLYWKEQLNFYAIICSYKLFHWVEEEILIYFPQSLISLKELSPGPVQYDRTMGMNPVLWGHISNVILKVNFHPVKAYQMKGKSPHISQVRAYTKRGRSLSAIDASNSRKVIR